MPKQSPGEGHRLKPLAIVTTHPIQYQTPFFRYLVRRGLPTHVFFLCERGVTESIDPDFGSSFSWDLPLLEGFSYEFLPNLSRRPGPERFLGLINPNILTRLTRERFCAVLVHGYRNLSMSAAIVNAKSRGLPLLYRSESNFLGGPPSFRTRQLGRFLSLSNAICLSIGSANDQFYERIGIPKSRRFLVPYSVDNARFQEEARALNKPEARSSLGLPQDHPIALFAGKLVPWKQPDRLLAAFTESAPPDSHLAFVGEGEMRAALEATASRIAPRRVTFLGFMNQREMGMAYRAADLLVLPSSHEPWGLVVNEAMNFGVPALVSDRVGCAPDLIQTTKTGWVFQHDDEHGLGRALNQALDRPATLRRVGMAARARVEKWGFEQAESGLRMALCSVGCSVRCGGA